MPKLREYLSVGFCESYGDADFSVKASVASLTYEQMKELRAMIPVAIGVMEKMWADENEKRHPAAIEGRLPPSLSGDEGNK
jgi:hypothetical protein